MQLKLSTLSCVLDARRVGMQQNHGRHVHTFIDVEQI